MSRTPSHSLFDSRLSSALCEAWTMMVPSKLQYAVDKRDRDSTTHAGMVTVLVCSPSCSAQCKNGHHRLLPMCLPKLVCKDAKTQKLAVTVSQSRWPMFVCPSKGTKMSNPGKCEEQQLLCRHSNPVKPMSFIPTTPYTFAFATRGCILR